jgi:hypothetical protein
VSHLDIRYAPDKVLVEHRDILLGDELGVDLNLELRAVVGRVARAFCDTLGVSFNEDDGVRLSHFLRFLSPVARRTVCCSASALCVSSQLVCIACVLVNSRVYPVV